MKVRQVYFGLIAIACVALTDLSFAQQQTQQQQQIQIKGPKDSTEQYSGATYGPIRNSDTLWRIANRYRQNKNLSIYQVMQAIYELNPEAFENNNFNELKNGAVIKLPSERYVSRVDSVDAKNRAELDDLNWQPRPGADGSVQATPLSPAETLASKVDLNQTKEDLEKKLVAIDEEQNRQFLAIRKQFAESISNVQTLLDENQKLYDRLDGVNQDIEGLRTRVDEELKIQIDQVLDIQNELLSISREAEAQRQAEMEKSSFAFLSDPLTIIIGSTLVTLSLLVGFAMWLLKRKKAQPVVEQPIMTAPVEAPMAEQATEMDDLTDALTDELSDDLDEDLGGDDLFGEDDLLDDVLSDELQESLDEALDEELESFDDLGDEMLVPEAEKEDEEEGEAVLEQGDLDNLFDDSEGLDDFADDLDAIDLSDTDELTEAVDEDASDELDKLLDQGDLDDLLDESLDELSEEAPPVETDDETPEEIDLDVEGADDALADVSPDSDDADESQVEEAIDSIEDEQEKPEISIDELLEEPEPALPEAIDIEEGEAVSEEMLQQLDKEISTQNQELDNITDELLNEIEQLEMMGDMLPPEEDEEQPVVEDSGETQHGIQELDELTDELVEEGTAEEQSDEQDDLADELLAEMGVDIDEPERTEETPESAAQESADAENLTDEQDDLADELLAEMGVDLDEPDTDALDSQDTETVSDEQDDLADELLAEMGVDTDTTEPENAVEDEQEADEHDALADELLSEMGVEEDVAEADAADGVVDAEFEADEQDDLADELLAEMGAEPEESAEVVAEEIEPSEGTLDAEFETEDDVSAEEPETEASDEVADEIEDELDSELEAEFEEPEEPTDTDAESESLAEDFPEADELPETEESTDIADEFLEEDVAVDDVLDEELPGALETDELPVTNDDIEESSVDELLDELDDVETQSESEAEASDAIDELDDIPSFTASDAEDSVEDSVEDSDEDSVEEVLVEEPELDSEEPVAEEQGDEFDKALDDFEQEIEVDIDAFAEDDAPQELVSETDAEGETEESAEQSAEKMVDDLPALGDIDALTDFDDSELEKALDSFAEEHEELVLEDEPQEATPSPSKAAPEELDDVPGLDDWLTEDDDQESLDDSLLEELENTSFDDLLDNIEGEAEETTKEQDALLDNPDLDLEALLTEDDSLDELDVELAENELEEPEDDFLDVDALLNESIEAESQPMTEKELDLDVSLEQFSGVSGDADSIDVDSDQGIGAKMDLARAYMEMEDSEQAREVLQEIVDKGEPEQKAEAEELLKQLS